MNINNTTKGIAFFAVASLLLLASCIKKTVEDTYEQKLIDEFLVTWNVQIAPTLSGLYYIEEIEGTGEFPGLSDTVEVFYKGMFLDGRVFDSNIGGNIFSFPLGERRVIPGWEEGLSYMKKGGKAMLLIPSNLAYGSTGQGAIPPFTPLLFSVELVDLKFGPNHIIE